MSEEELSYFYRRAEEEIGRAQQSNDPRLVNFHYRLSDLYLERVFAEDFCPWPRGDQRSE